MRVIYFDSSTTIIYFFKYNFNVDELTYEFTINSIMLFFIKKNTYSQYKHRSKRKKTTNSKFIISYS